MAVTTRKKLGENLFTFIIETEFTTAVTAVSCHGYKGKETKKQGQQRKRRKKRGGVRTVMCFKGALGIYYTLCLQKVRAG